MAKRTDVLDRVCRSAYANCSEDDWVKVVELALKQGTLNNGGSIREVIDFNARAEKFSGTVREFLTAERPVKRTRSRKRKS